MYIIVIHVTVQCLKKIVSSYCISIPSAINMGMELSIGIFTSTLLI